jgi:Fe-Mn family superoxide dismutase
MQYELPQLPYDVSALAPAISKETLEYHYGKHHAGYIKKLNKALQKAPDRFANCSLSELVCQVSKDEPEIFNNAAQAWNHTFYWNSMTPASQGKPGGDFGNAIAKKFGSVEALQEAFVESAKGQFGSGWAWVILDSAGDLAIMTTGNADNPLREGAIPLLVCDVWEHAYYIDYRNRRGTYLKAFWQVANWQFATEKYNEARIERAA